MLNIIISVIAAIIICLTVIRIRENHDRRKQSHDDSWKVTVFREPGVFSAQEFFPISDEEKDALANLDPQSVEDAAACYALFMAYNVDGLDPRALIIASNHQFGTYAFHPTFDAGHLDGLERTALPINGGSINIDTNKNIR